MMMWKWKSLEARCMVRGWRVRVRRGAAHMAVAVIGRAMEGHGMQHA